MNALQPQQALKRFFGYDAFRPGQIEIVDALLAGRDALAVMPTGAGKSICYQVPALCLDGYALVVSPLISLMKDQVSALMQAGVKAAYINSQLSPREREETMQFVEDGGCKLLYVAPERLGAPEFVALCKRIPPALIAVDEAHCVSQWGQDFRPSYTRIAQFIDGLPARPAVGAFTATATQAVRSDIVSLLRLSNPHVLVASYDRPNLHFSVQRPRDKDAALLELCEKHKGESGIVYCSSRRAVDEVRSLLESQGFEATSYHAGLSAQQRHTNQDDFVFDRAKICVATTAFGMGIDKSNVSFVIHYNLPLDLESYYQEAGRAGRDGGPAECVLLYAKRDVKTCEFLISKMGEENDELDWSTKGQVTERAYERLRQMTFYATTNDCLRGFLLRYFGESAPVHCGSCGNCETRFEELDATEHARKVISCVFRVGQRGRTMGKTAIVDILRGSRSDRILSNRFDELSTYGIMSDVSAPRIRNVLDALIERGVLGLSAGQYPVVQFTDRSMEFLRGGEKLLIKVPKEKGPVGTASGKGGARKGKKAASLSTGDYDEGLFEHLRALRSQIAQEEGVAAFIIFSNATLADMCRRMPQTRDELLEVSGVGVSKADRYGQRFLDALGEWRGKTGSLE